jgi:ParB family chromosome partitioning protein
MSANLSARVLRQIPVHLVDVLNPRERNARTFGEIVANIKAIGLKKPVMVTPRVQPDGTERFLLMCGEGRLTAFRNLGEKTIPAFVVDVNDEDAFIVSITENIARRRWSPLELLAGIEQLQTEGYTTSQISSKTGLTFKYVQGMLSLLANGERRLMLAVETGKIPLNAALSIVGAGDDDKAVQAALQDAYEAGTLRGNRLILARRVIERRAALGKSSIKKVYPRSSDVTSSSMVRTFQREVQRQKQMVRKASFVQQRLAFVVGAMQQLLADEHFFTLLRAEGLETLPKYVAERIWPDGRHT